jgi:murein DD-endopeptidase MepM/ murein hydrolase activator NlpD
MNVKPPPLDIATPWGTPVMAAANGTVIFAGWQSSYGQIVIIDHGNGITTRYGHLSGIDVEVGQQIASADILGRVGSTSRSTGPHLHYEVRIKDEPVDPRRFLPGAIRLG